MTPREAIAGAVALTKGRIARGSIASLAIKVSAIGLVFVQAILAVRLLGVAGFGSVAIALSIAQLISILALFGYHAHAIRKVAADMAQHRIEETRKYISKAFIAVLGLSLFAGAILIAIELLTPGILSKIDGIALATAALVPVLACIQLFRGINQGLGRVAHAQMPNEIVRPLLIIAGLTLLFLVDVPINTASYMQLVILANCSALVWIALLLGRYLKNLSPKATPDVQSSLSISGPSSFFVITLFAALQGELGTLSLFLLSTSEQAGLFQPVARLIPIIGIMAAAAQMPFFPRIAQLWSLGKLTDAAALTRKYTLTISGLTALTALAIGIFAPFVMRAFGPEFAIIAPLVWIVCAAKTLSAMCGPAGNLLIVSGHARLVPVGHSIALVCASVAAISYVPALGAAGAVIAVGTYIVVLNLILLFFARRKVGFDPSILGAVAPFIQNRKVKT